MEEENLTNLIVNYLPQTLTDNEFLALFRSIGAIKNCKIVRDKASNYSYGFGFVDFEQPGDAQTAINTLNGFQLQNKKIKVALARKGGDNIKGANLYIKNIPRDATSEMLQEWFQDFGRIIQSRVLIDQDTGQSKGVGFILFDRKEEAEAAISSLNGKSMREGDVPLLVKYAEDNSQKVRPPQVCPMGVGYHNKFGGPMRNNYMMNRFGGNRYNPMLGNNSYSSQTSGLSVSQGGWILFVYNIGPNTNENGLYKLFNQFGTVQKVNVIYDRAKGQTKNYGFVTMTNYQDAQHAIECLNGHVFYGKPLTVSFKTN